MTILLSSRMVGILHLPNLRQFLFPAAYSVMVDENVTTGAELIRVAASDADSGERGSIRFTLSGTGVSTRTHTHTHTHAHAHTQSERFAVGAVSGAVRVAAELDREEEDFYQLTITATDQGTPPLRYTIDT